MNKIKKDNLLIENSVYMLEIDLPNVYCCIDMCSIIRTLPFIRLQSIPQASDYIKGYYNLCRKKNI